MFDDMYYRHSGRFSVTGVVAGLAAGTLAAVALSFVYSYATLYVPWVYASVLICLAYAAGIGFSSVASMVQFKVRSTLMMTVVTLFTTTVGFYVCWVVWLFALLRRGNEDVNLVSMLSQPTEIWDLVLDVNRLGAWTIGKNGNPVTGIFLWVVWAGEALMIFGVPIAIVCNAIAKPFCEECETWCKEQKAIAVLSVDDAESLRGRMEAKEFAYLERIGPAPLGAGQWTQLDLYVCPNCGKTTTLTVSEVTERVNRKGEKSTSTKTFVNKLLLDPAQTETLRQTCGRIEAKRLGSIETEATPTEPAS